MVAPTESGRIQFDNGGIYIHRAADLPNFYHAHTVYCDLETTSGTPTEDSINPHHFCDVAGIAITVDDCPQAYYIDYMRMSPEDQHAVRCWLWHVIHTCTQWVNHNIKYDAHVLENCLEIPIYAFLNDNPCLLVCSLTLAKIIDSDRVVRGGYGLDALSFGWLKKDISGFEKRMKPYLNRKKDYGKIPGDILGEYACQDVLTNRELYHYECAQCPAQCAFVWWNEIELTGNLYRMERNGLRVDKIELMKYEYQLLNRMCELDAELAHIVGRSFRPHVSADLFDIFCCQYGLPVLLYTKDEEGHDSKNASFDKHALELYSANPLTPLDVLDRVKEYKKLSQRDGLFLKPWQKVLLEDNGQEFIRAIYNQCVRTGRMSCSDPNMQQLDKFMKTLIYPRRGNAFLSADYSQIEFRFIGHYIQSEMVINAYRENPDADFHQLVADWCGIKRKPAKNVNFGIAFGEGKKKLTAQLASNIDLVGRIRDYIKDQIAAGTITEAQSTALFNQLASQKALEVFNTYHNTFPTLRSTMKAAENALKAKGYVFNMYGRHRHLPAQYAYRAFNTLNQSSAADLMKAQFNELCREMRNTELLAVANVHDEILLEGPIEQIEDARTQRDVAAIMEHPTIERELRVPIRTALGTSRKDWAEACSEPKDGGTQRPLHYNLAEAGRLRHLKSA